MQLQTPEAQIQFTTILNHMILFFTDFSTFLQPSTESRCYDELGCLNLTNGWYHIFYRPVNVFPLPRQTIDTKFILYTRLNPTEGQILRATDDPGIEKSNFDLKKQTKFIIHGFVGNPDNFWIKEMRRELLKHSDWNVVVVDWAGGSLPPYTQATANTRLVGLELAFFINHLKNKYQLEPKDVHLIGYSLGAHTAGYAGQNVPGLGRITGLDPARPYFQGMPSKVRLDPGDAQLVDVIHTDGVLHTDSCLLLGKGYGMVDPCGHLDFYPNNGTEQPGCDVSENSLPLILITGDIEEAATVLLACSHSRAVKLFIESINSQCPYLAHRCPSYQHFLQGKCFSCGPNDTNCAFMGLHTNRGLLSPGAKFFFQTGKEPPYCRRHYRVTVELGQRPASWNPWAWNPWVQGFMRVSLHSDQGKIRDLDLTPNGYEKLKLGTSRSFVVSHMEEIGTVTSVEIYWEYVTKLLEPESYCIWPCDNHLYVSSVRVSASKILNSREKRAVDVVSKLCSPDHRGYAVIDSGSKALFSDNC